MKEFVKVFLLFVAMQFQQGTYACSIFTSSKNEQVLVGANEDTYTSFHHMWFIPAFDGKYGAVFFGEHNMQTQAGMNEHGLFFDFAAIPRIESENREIKFITIAEILATCKTVDEALSLYQKHTYSSYASQMLLADATGKSVLINADTVVHKTADYQITTNFNICDLRDKSYNCLRYDIIEKALAKTDKISISLFQDILEDVHQEGKIATQYSNVYDLRNGKIYMNWFHNYGETVVIDLNEELKKGFRIESLGDRFQQKTFAAINFQESEDGYFYNTLLHEFSQDGPQSGFKMFEDYSAANPDKLDLARDNLNWIPYGLIAKARIAYDNLSFDYYYIPSLHHYKTLWRSNNELLHRSLDILDYIRDNQLIDSDFFYHEALGYIHMVLGSQQTAVENYEAAITASEKGSREWIRATNTLAIIKNDAPSQDVNEQLKYLKQRPPTSTPEVFAPNLVSKNNEYEFGSVFNRQGTEFFYGVDVNGKEEIRYSKLTGDAWSAPKVLLEHPVFGYNDPFLSPDEDRLYFISRRAMDGKGEPKDYDIWYVEKEGAGWSAPINAGSNINTSGNEYYISFSNDGTMYFSSNKNEGNFDIYTSKMLNGEFQSTEQLDGAINTVHYEADVFVAPDESYLIFCATKPDGFGEGDLYISFKNTDGSWTQSKNMGDVINSKGHELCPYVTADGKYLFYTSNKDIYWVSAVILENYR